MFKAFIINMVLDAVFDELLKVLKKFSHRSSSKIDDKLVALITRERSNIVKEIKAQL